MKFRFTEERLSNFKTNNNYGPVDSSHLFTTMYEAGSEDYVTHLMDQPESTNKEIIMHTRFENCDFVAKPTVILVQNDKH